MALVATLIANPSNPILTETLVSKLASAVQATEYVWLDHGIAVDMKLDENAKAQETEMALRDAVGKSAIDVVIQSARRTPQDGASGRYGFDNDRPGMH